MRKTFVMKKTGHPGVIPLGAERVFVEPGKPFAVDGDDAIRFVESPDYDEVTDTPAPAKTKGGDGE